MSTVNAIDPELIQDIATPQEAVQPTQAASVQPPADGLRFPDILVYRGYSAPVRMECDVYDLEVTGRIPEGLNGAYYRNSADPQYPPLHGTDIFLNGDGMIHKVRLQNGHADLKTRYVQTAKLALERQARRALFGVYRNPYTDDVSVVGKDSGTANTSLLWHGGRLFATKESQLPMMLDPETLETRGLWDFGGELKGHTFTAHAKLDPVTGECIAFAYNSTGQASREVHIFTIDRAGVLVRSESFEAPYCSMIHDCHVSRNYVVFTICPMVCDWERVKRGKPYWHWDSTKKTYVAIIPRKSGVKGIRWYTCPKVAMQTHTFNAWEEGSTLNIDHFVTGSGWLSQFPDLHDSNAQEKPPFGERWSFNLSNPKDELSIAQLFPHIGEMPVIDPRHAMQRNRHFWFGTFNPTLGPMLARGPKGPPFTCLGHFDEKSNTLNFYYAGADSAPEEPCFVPKNTSAAEGDGWLLSMVGRRAENRTDLVILDSLQIERGPVATIHFPCRLHEGFHGIFVDAAALGWP